MLEQVKMPASKFILGLKHGVYVFVSDACEFCRDYAKTLTDIDNCHLHIVECVTDADKSAVYQLTGKGALPITASFIDGELQWVELGQIFWQMEGSDDPDPTDWTLNKLSKYLKDVFGEAPLTSEQIVSKLKTIDKHCVFAYYVFPPNTNHEIKKKVLNSAFEHHELPIDIDEIDALDISIEDKMIMLMSNVVNTKLVVFDLTKTDSYSEIANKLLAEYLSYNRNTASFEMREL